MINFKQWAQSVIESSLDKASNSLVDTIQENLIKAYHRGKRDREDSLLGIEATPSVEETIDRLLTKYKNVLDNLADR